MRKLLLITLPLLLIVGCSKEPINYETTLIERDGVFYTKDTNKPYSGPVFYIYENGQNKQEGYFKEGMMNSHWTYYFEDGKKNGEGSYLNGDGTDSGITGIPMNGRVGKWTFWYENGKKEYEGTYKDGKQDGLVTQWYENGQIFWKGTLKDGEQQGLHTYWYENGKKSFEETYKDGELISKKEWNEDGSVIEVKNYSK
jgi:antitoxin component YwqK of YwqJK toxin-antitoxin module